MSVQDDTMEGKGPDVLDIGGKTGGFGPEEVGGCCELAMPLILGSLVDDGPQFSRGGPELGPLIGGCEGREEPFIPGNGMGPLILCGGMGPPGPWPFII